MPILGGYGNASEYAYRGFIIDTPNPFDWIDLYNVEPGREYLSGYAKITGIKSPLPLRVSIGSSFSLISNVFDNNQTVTFDNNDPNEASFDEYTLPNSRFKSGLGFDVINDLVENNQSIILSINIPVTPDFPVTSFDANIYRFDQYNPRFSSRIDPVSAVEGDFANTYTTLVSVGRSDQDWIVQTKELDDTPDSFSFTNVVNYQTSSISTSNSITITGFEPYYKFPANIVVRNQGSIIVDGKPAIASTDVYNGSIIQLQTTSSDLFETKKDVEVLVSTFSTTWSVTTEVENLDVTFTPTDFTDQSNRNLNRNYDSNQITISGLSLNSDLPVTLSIGSYEVERSGSIVKSFTDSPIEVVNNDKIRLRLRSSGSYSRNVSTTMTIGNTSADWVLTTRAAPPVVDPPVVDPPPCQESYQTYGYGGGYWCSSGIREGRWAQTGPTWTGESTYNGNPNDFQDAPPGSGKKRSINNLYIQYLKRGADPGGMINYNEYWISRYSQGASDSQIRNEIVRSILDSAEYASDWWRNNSIRTKCGGSIFGIISNVRCRQNL